MGNEITGWTGRFQSTSVSKISTRSTSSRGGVLEQLFDGARRVNVNSLHAQAVDHPGEGVFVEAISDDGVIEAISVPDAPALTFGVQWHPEHPNMRKNDVNGRLFAKFSEAVHIHFSNRTGIAIDTRAA